MLQAAQAVVRWWWCVLSTPQTPRFTEHLNVYTTHHHTADTIRMIHPSSHLFNFTSFSVWLPILRNVLQCDFQRKSYITFTSICSIKSNTHRSLNVWWQSVRFWSDFVNTASSQRAVQRSKFLGKMKSTNMKLQNFQNFCIAYLWLL